MRIHVFYPPDFVRTVFVGVTTSDQTIFNVGVSFCADFRLIIYPDKRIKYIHKKGTQP